MNTISKVVISVLGAAVVVLYGYILFHPSSTILIGGANPTGTTYSTARIAMTDFTGVTSSTTASVIASFVNTDSGDRIISSVDGYFAGLTSPAVTVWVATSTTAFATTTSTYVVNGLVLGTSGNLYLASTSPSGIASDAFRVWASGQTLNVLTSTSSAMTGVIGVKYFSQ